MRRTRRAIRLADAHALRGAARRTMVLRVALVLALAAGGVLLLLEASRGTGGRERFAPAGPSGVVVLDVSSSIEVATFRQIDAELERASRSGQRFGLVLFSDLAYEAFPPGTAAAELAALRRYFTPVPRAVDQSHYPTQTVGSLPFLVNPWTDSLTGGTRISTALRLARSMLVREGLDRGPVVLISDLDDDYRDLPVLQGTLALFTRERIPLRVVGLSASPGNLRLFRAILGDPSFVSEADVPQDPGAAAPVPLPEPGLQRGLLVGGVALLAALAALELLLPRVRTGGRRWRRPA
jgi:hypothetical protein